SDRNEGNREGRRQVPHRHGPLHRAITSVLRAHEGLGGGCRRRSSRRLEFFAVTKGRLRPEQVSNMVSGPVQRGEESLAPGPYTPNRYISLPKKPLEAEVAQLKAGLQI